MGDGGYIFDEELSPDFLEFEKFSFFQELGSDQKAFELTMNTFKINKEALLKIIEDNGGKLKRLEISKTWNGLCPESLLKGREVKMRLNNSDFYESEETGLQIAVLSGVQAVIMNFRGTGDFRSTVSYADEIENGELLSPQNTERPPFNNPTEVFQDSEQIENYIKDIKPNSFDKPFVSDSSITTLLQRKLDIEKQIETILKEKGFAHFSSKKFVGDLGEYYALINLEHLFEVGSLKLSDISNSPFDISGVLKSEVAEKWQINPNVRIEVKTRFHQQGNPHLFGLNQDNFELLAFISLNNDYSVHFVGIIKKDDLPPIDKQNRIIFSDKIKLVYPEKVKFQKHQQ